MSAVESTGSGVNTWISLGRLDAKARDKDKLLDTQPMSFKKRCTQNIAACTASKPVSIALRVGALVGALSITAAGGYCLYTAFTCSPVRFVCALPGMGGAVISLAGLYLSAQVSIGLRDRIQS